MKTINIKGKDYVPVHERIKHLRDTCGYSKEMGYSIETVHEYYSDRKMWVVHATLTIRIDEEEYTYTGLAQEVESDDYKQVNFSSALENCETSAVGRAIAMAGIGIDTGIASSDEMTKALRRSEQKPVADNGNKELSDKQFQGMLKRYNEGEEDIFKTAEAKGFVFTDLQQSVLNEM